jgi:hypothetical protein
MILIALIYIRKAGKQEVRKLAALLAIYDY